MMMYEQTKEIIEQVRILLGIDDKDLDMLLGILIDSAISAVLAYCHIDVLPVELHSLIAQIATDTYRDNGYGSTQTPVDIKSISEGDRSISQEVRSNTNGFLNNYIGRLKPWRNMRGRVPSDV